MNIALVIEKADEGFLGRICYEDNLIVDEAETIPELENNLRSALHNFHHLPDEDIVFEHEYDLTALFEKFHYLKISAVAEKAGINPGLLRQYTSGVKTASPAVAMKLEDAIHAIAKELENIHVYKK